MNKFLISAMLQSSTLQFLRQLSKNNTKEWFDKHRSAYDAAKADFAGFVGRIIEKHGQQDPDIAGLETKNCIFRINRDVRFSKDKSPYKNNMGASIKKGGKKSIFAGYYFHLQPGGESFVGGGLWMPGPVELGKVRQEIDYNWEDFQSIITSKKFRSVYPGLDESPEFKLTRPPKNYDATHPAIEFLKLKSFITMVSLTDKDLTDRAAFKKILTAFSAIQPFLRFINRSIEE